MKIIYVSKSTNKYHECERLLNTEAKEKKLTIELVKEATNEGIEELQTKDIDKLLRDKALKAFKKYNMPILVEQTTLEIECLNNYPYLETDSFWESLKQPKDKSKVTNSKKGIKTLKWRHHRSNKKQEGSFICKMVTMAGKTRAAKVTTHFAYCDGRTIIIERGEVKGEISQTPRGNEGFGWDTIFIPEGQNKTYAELEKEKIKDKYSMRAKAVKNLVNTMAKKQSTLVNEPSEPYRVGKDLTLIKQIATDIENDSLVLFIGAGTSSSLRLPSWSQLIGKLGNELGFDADVFATLGDSLETAEYYKLKKGDIQSLRTILKEGIDENELKQKIYDSKIFKYLTKLGVNTIYTTNYESIIEYAFNIHNKTQPYRVIYDLETLNNKKKGVEIIKLHGSLEKYEEMVLTQTSYFERFNFENCLDIRMRNDLLTKSVLFIGYSFNDPNIRYMFHKLNEIWKQYGVQNNRPSSYIFLTESNPIRRSMLEQNKVRTIVYPDIDKSNALGGFLQDIYEQLANSKEL